MRQQTSVAPTNFLKAGKADTGACKKASKAKPEVVQLSRVNLKTFLQSQLDRFVGIDFVKKDGSRRMLNGRLGVKSLLKGGRNKVEAIDRPYVTLFDAQLNQYRTVNLETVSQVRASGKVYDVID